MAKGVVLANSAIIGSLGPRLHWVGSGVGAVALAEVGAVVGARDRAVVGVEHGAVAVPGSEPVAMAHLLGLSRLLQLLTVPGAHLHDGKVFTCTNLCISIASSRSA